ncbi:PBECR3 domain-containing polyvalent protein [Blautia sp. Marseille-P3201T]|uniref:PBECR3 domain-containing polyvalent protein n=1 Tax=Blautia sp. Marseille-P3201T TaxID=1907659 RepID=UPI0013566DEC
MTNSKIFPVASYNKKFNNYLPVHFNQDFIYQSSGLEKHIKKRHPECLPYLKFISSIISSPDYIGVNPNEIGDSFELVKTFHENIQIGIKLDMKENYLYIATLHTITNGKLKHGIANGRLKKFDK